MKKKILSIVIIVILAFSVLAFLGVGIAHDIVFRRADYSEYDSEHYLLYEQDVDHTLYPRETLSISSGSNLLTAYFYGDGNPNGLIVISPGHRDTNDIKLYETLAFVDAGYSVLCYDYTGCYTSAGRNMVGYTQSVHDLDAVLTYVEKSERWANLPLYLFGHSLGGYATGAVLANGHHVDKAILASPLNTPEEQWQYSIQRYTGLAYPLLRPFNALYIRLTYGEESTLSAIDGINSVTIPIMVVSGEQEDYYGGPSSVYLHRDQVTNPNCTFVLMSEENHNGHYDYFLTDEAIAYRNSNPTGVIDKELYSEHDPAVMHMFIDFFEE